jgi:hypothetical protein
MTEETLNAVILRLQSSGVECFEVIKARCAGPLDEGDVDFIAQQSMRLANLEGAIITLQQYAGTIEAYAQELEVSKARAVLAAQLEATEVVATPPAPEDSITEAELAERSPTFRRSQGGKKSKKKVKKDE